jgi:hypothetical protein
VNRLATKFGKIFCCELSAFFAGLATKFEAPKCQRLKQAKIVFALTSGKRDSFLEVEISALDVSLVCP